MAMNKKEQAAMEALRIERDMARALSWPGTRPKSPTWKELDAILAEKGEALKGHNRKVIVGWSFNAHRSHGNAVTQTAYNGMYQHRDFEGYKPNYGGWSQIPYNRTDDTESGIFMTRKEAIQALAWEKAMAFAKAQAVLIAEMDDPMVESNASLARGPQ